MNENHNPDKAQEIAIERLVHGKKASGNELLDMLGNTKPKADPSFMANLEERLMAEFSSKEKEKMMMKRKERPGKFGRWPLTMAAAVFAILLVGGLALFMQQNPTDEASGIVMNPVSAVVAVQALNPGTIIEEHMVEVRSFIPDANLNQDALFRNEELVIGTLATEYIAVDEPILASQIRFIQSPTSTPMPMVPVVIAIQDIPGGTEITASMVEVIHFPAANAPSGAFVEEEDVVGLTARTTIYMEEIILARKISTQACPETSSEYSLYTVRAGDTLFSIAETENVQVSELIAINCLEGVAGVAMGQVIRIPSEIDDFALTATAIIATSTASADFGETALIVPNAPEPLGCHNDNARILYPLNGQMIDRPVSIRAIANHDEFAQSRIEISGPSTNEQFVVIASISQQALVETEIGQFVPTSYEDGEYQLRLNTFNTINNQVGTCTITIYIDNQASNTGQENLRPVVIAVRDIPMNTVITEDMVMLSYWPDEIAMQFAMENNGQWYLDNLEGVVGMMTRDFIPTHQPISSELVWRNFCDENVPCIIRPFEGTAVALPNIDNSFYQLQVGQSVDVIASFLFVETSEETFQVSTDTGRLWMGRVISNAQVLWVGSNPPNEFWSEDLDPELSANENLIVINVSVQDKIILEWLIEADLPMMVVPHLEGAEAVEIQQSSNEIQSENISMMVWMDASALSFSRGQHVDVLGQFIYIGADGQLEGMISHRMGVNWIVRDVEAGEGEMAAYALVSLDIDESSLVVGQMIPGIQSILQSDTHILASWSLIPYNPELGESIQYFSYNNLAEPMPVDASSVSDGHYYVGLPNLELESTAGGLTVGDTVHVILEDGQVIEAQLSYIGSSIYAPFAMQPVLDEYRTENPRVMVFEVSSAAEVNTISSYVGNSQPITIQRLR